MGAGGAARRVAGRGCARGTAIFQSAGATPTSLCRLCSSRVAAASGLCCFLVLIRQVDSLLNVASRRVQQLLEDSGWEAGNDWETGKSLSWMIGSLARSDVEEVYLSDRPANFRLSCRTSVNGDVTLRTKPTNAVGQGSNSLVGALKSLIGIK